jgi:hypothetical protein
LDGKPVAIFAPTYKMMSDVWRETYNTVLPTVKRVSAQEHRLELITGGVIDMWSLDTPDAPRGRKYQRVVIDEAAMGSDYRAVDDCLYLCDALIEIRKLAVLLTDRTGQTEASSTSSSTSLSGGR